MLDRKLFSRRDIGANANANTTNHPQAHGENGTQYSCDLYGKEVLDVVNSHDHTAGRSLFVYLPLHDTHSPYECLPKWEDPRVKQPLRQLMQCMLTCTDDVVGQVDRAAFVCLFSGSRAY